MLFTVIKILKMLGIGEIAQPIGEDRQEIYVMTTLDLTRYIIFAIFLDYDRMDLGLLSTIIETSKQLYLILKSYKLPRTALLFYSQT